MSADRQPPRAVLFDLDGTLIDSAPDLAGAANSLRAEHGLAPLPYEHLRPMVGAGARGMVGAAFGVVPGDDRFDSLRDDFLARYERTMLDRTRLFDGVAVLLAALEGAGIGWGIVTNKASRFAVPVAVALGLSPRTAAMVCGDTTPHAKPHPEPLWEAARRLGRAPGECLYVGDDLRDVQAGRSAGMATMVAAWGYLGQGEAVDAWGADAVIESPAELLKWLELA
jgi:phosphoglycolate phosphatase